MGSGGYRFPYLLTFGDCGGSGEDDRPVIE